MCRYLSALLILGLAVPFAGADYLLIKVDLEQFNYSSLAGKQVSFVPYEKDGPHHWVYANFKLPRSLKDPPKVYPVENTRVVALELPWGKKGAKGCIPLFNCVVPEPMPQESLALVFSRKKKKEAGDGNPDALLRLAGWALARGLTRDFHATMEELQKKAPNRPAVQNYGRVKKELKKPFAGDDPNLALVLNDIRAEGYRELPSDQGHFVLLYRTDAPLASLKRRLTHMEEHLENVFYWFALREKIALPPMPKHRLAVQLVDSPQEFWKRHREWESPPQIGDGFFLRAHNLAVICANRTDDAYKALEQNLQPVRQTLGLTRNDLLDGQVWERPFARNASEVLTLATVQMLTILQKVMEEDGERVTIDHLCTRQIFGATGLLPRRVATPEWVQWGVASYFETPPGSLHQSLGLPSIEHFMTFRDLRRKKKLGKSSEVLVHVFTDQYFRLAQQDKDLLRDLKEEPEEEIMEGKKSRREYLSERIKENLDLAHSTSWALVYYLALTGKTDYLTRYCKQLDELPRDLELNKNALEACFARAFDLESVSNPMKLDPGKLQAFANAWFQEMENVNLDNSLLEAFRTKVNPPPMDVTNPNDPNNPMGGKGPMPKGPGGKMF